MVGVIGPNGAGKSTTIKMLSGILYPDSGEINISGYIPYKQRKEYVANIGVVFGQKSQLAWDLPVIDSFELLKHIYRIPEDRYKKNLDRFIEMLDMSGFINQPVRQLSLGQRMRADIVAALLHSPKIVFFDEPTIGVDVVGKEKIRKSIGIRERFGTTRQLDVEFAGNVEIEPIQDVEIKQLDELDGRKKRFVFENTKVHIDELMSELLSKYNIKDLSITEPEIESIIREIYSGGVNIQ